VLTQQLPLTPSSVDVSREEPEEISTRESRSAPDANRERHPPRVLHDRDSRGDCIDITSPPLSPKKDLRAQNSPCKALSPDLTMSNDAGNLGDVGSKESGFLQLNKSNSVVARVSMFAQLEEEMKRAAKEAKTKLPKGSNRSVVRREESSQSGNRFATQPVTMGEVQEAVRSATSRDADPTLTGTSLSCVWMCAARKMQHILSAHM